MNTLNLGISIHTSPKGGDLSPRLRQGSWIISIHTSPKGGDGSLIRSWYVLSYFNPHLPEGR